MSLVERTLDKMRRAGNPAAPTPVPTAPTIGAPENPGPRSGDAPAEPRRRIVLDRRAMREHGYLPEDGNERHFADYYRRIKRPLITRAASGQVQPGQGDPRLIMVASAMSGDGKTFTSINLAMSIARERDLSVVLVDADVLKPHVSQIFGLSEERGLLAALEDSQIDVESLILDTDLPGFSILPAGTSKDGATELIASARMRGVMSRLLANDPRRIVVFDSAPVIVSSEARALASVAGQVVLVVSYGRTPRKAVLDAVEQLGERDDVSLVLNQGPADHSSYYGYGSGSSASSSAIERKTHV